MDQVSLVADVSFITGDLCENPLADTILLLNKKIHTVPGMWQNLEKG